MGTLKWPDYLLGYNSTFKKENLTLIYTCERNEMYLIIAKIPFRRSVISTE